MSAEVLRLAAAKMRKRAEAASPIGVNGAIPWHTTADLSEYDPEDAEHIASWHPAVALAVADLFDAVRMTNPPAQLLEDSPVIRVARAYLNEQP